MPGKLIVFEGTDGSGKSTQFQALCARVEQTGTPFRRLVFPQYQEPSSALIRMYLGGEFGSRPGDVNPYAASAFYAVDRYASLKKVWGEYYSQGGLILTDRYTTSNAVHQGAKCAPQERPAFLGWLDDFEHDKLGLPRADLVLYLDMPTRCSLELLRSREAATHTQGTSTRWIPTIWPPAGTAPSRLPGSWAGRSSPASRGTAACARWRRSTGRCGPWSPPC